jgi:hypothetical protein
MYVRCERTTIKARSLSLVTSFHVFFSYPTLHILTTLPIIDLPVYILASLYSQSSSSSMQIHLQVFLTLLTHSQQTTTMRLITLTTFLIPTLAAAGRLGGIDMNSACRDQYGDWVAYVSLAGGGCNAWKCAPSSGEATPRGIDTPRACVKQYGGGAYALCYNGEYDWSCYRN